MHVSKPAAALTGGLLARKGMARPAMRRQLVPGAGGASPQPVEDDLGWNDMGDDLPPPPAAPAPSPVALHLAAIEAGLDKPAELEADQPPAKRAALKLRAVGARKSAFTLRIDAERHLRLRLLSAVSNRSAQQLLIQALDQLIAENPNIEKLAADPKARSGAGAE